MDTRQRLLLVGFGAFVLVGLGILLMRQHSVQTNVGPVALTAAPTADSTSEGPNVDAVSKACQGMIAAGPLTYILRLQGQQLPQFILSSADIVATSIDNASNTAVVKAVCHLTYSGESNEHLGTIDFGRPGFGRWFDNDKVWNNGDTVAYSVTFHFRRFDTGWSVESND